MPTAPTSKPRFVGEKVKLEGRVEYVRGVTYKAAIDLHQELDYDSYILLRANNIQDGDIIFEDVQYVDKSKVKAKQLLRKGDILICASSGSKGLVGKAALVKEDTPVTFGAFCCVLRSKYGESKLLDYYFQSCQYRRAIEEACSGSSINNLKAANFDALIVPRYLEAEMHEIEDIFEFAASQLRQAKAQIIELDSLVKSRFVEMFGDAQVGYKFELQSLGSMLSTEPQNGLYKPQRFYVERGGTPIVRVDAFQKGCIENYSALKRLTCTSAELKTYELVNNDIVINRVNGSIDRVGKIAWIRGLQEPTVFESNMMRFHIDEKRMSLAFVTTYLNSGDIRQQIKACARIANQCSINQTNVANFEIPVPPLSLQQEFADFVAQVDKSRFVRDHEMNFR